MTADCVHSMAITHQGSFNSTPTGDFTAQFFCNYDNIQFLLTGTPPPLPAVKSQMACHGTADGSGAARHWRW